MLMGLIKPDGGEIRVFGHAIRPGAPVLSRVGAFVEGAGFLPHLSGRENLELYWQATGRPAEDAHLEEALEIAGLGDALRARGPHLLPGHAPAPRHRPGHARPARPAHPRRTDQRPRPAPDPRDARGDDPVRGGRPHGDRLQPPARRGRAVLHPPRRHGPRPAGPGGPGRRDHRLRRHPARRHRRRPWRSRSSRRSPRCRASAPPYAPTTASLVRLDAETAAPSAWSSNSSASKSPWSRWAPTAAWRTPSSP